MIGNAATVAPIIASSTPPSQVTPAPVLVALHSNYVDFTWTVPASWGTGGTGTYLIEGSINAGVTWFTIQTVPSYLNLTCRVLTYDGATALVGSTAYQFRVSAVGGTGLVGTPSPVLSVTTTAAAALTNVSFAYSPIVSATPAARTLTIDPQSIVAGIGFPSGRPNGQDRLFLVVVYDMSSKSRVAYGPISAGWTNLAHNTTTSFGLPIESFVGGGPWSFDVYTKVASGSAGILNTDTAYTISSSNGVGFAACWSVRGAAANIHLVSQPGTNTGSTTATCPSVTTTAANELCLALAVPWSALGITASSQVFGTTDVLVNNQGASGYPLLAAHYTQVAAGATGTKAFTVTSGSALVGVANAQWVVSS
jgi:hypothetical protein